MKQLFRIHTFEELDEFFLLNEYPTLSDLEKLVKGCLEARVKLLGDIRIEFEEGSEELKEKECYLDKLSLTLKENLYTNRGILYQLKALGEGIEPEYPRGISFSLTVDRHGSLYGEISAEEFKKIEKMLDRGIYLSVDEYLTALKERLADYTENKRKTEMELLERKRRRVLEGKLTIQ